MTSNINKLFLKFPGNAVSSVDLYKDPKVTNDILQDSHENSSENNKMVNPANSET